MSHQTGCAGRIPFYDKPVYCFPYKDEPVGLLIKLRQVSRVPDNSVAMYFNAIRNDFVPMHSFCYGPEEYTYSHMTDPIIDVVENVAINVVVELHQEEELKFADNPSVEGANLYYRAWEQCYNEGKVIIFIGKLAVPQVSRLIQFIPILLGQKKIFILKPYVPEGNYEPPPKTMPIPTKWFGPQ